MPVQVHRAAATGELVDALGDLLSTPLPDPFDQELVVVPAKGVERWLAQRLSHRLGAGPRGGDGVCAGVRFMSPHSLHALLTGIRSPADDPWHPDRSAWALLGVLQDSLGEDWCRPLAVHLGHESATPDLDAERRAARRSRRWSVAHRLAGLIASYADQRPALLTAWAAGEEESLAPDLRWQPELYRRLVAAVAARDGEPAPDVRHRDLVRSLLRDDADVPGLARAGLPARLSLFGYTRLSVTQIELLAALAHRREVHLWLPLASPALWDDVRAHLPADHRPVPRVEDASADLVEHRLLASLGRDTRELPRVLSPLLDDAVDHVVPAPRGTRDATTRLQWLQDDIRADREPAAAERAARVPETADSSIQVHACHGAARQVEVLREVLTGLLEDDPTLEPRDIIVLCPDVDTFAPLVQAAFGLPEVAEAAEGGGHPGHRLRVTLADRAPTTTNPLLDLAVRLLDLSRARLTTTEVLDLLDTDVVRRRFAFSEEELDRLARWIGDVGIRWGLDAEHRAPFAMAGVPENTWRAGTDRLLAGVALGEHDVHGDHGFDATLPLDDVASTDVDLAGRFVEFLDRLDLAFEAFRSASTTTAWATALADAVTSLGDVAPSEAWQRADLERELTAMTTAADDADTGPHLVAVEVRRLLAGRWRGRPTRAGFRLGTITVCTMVPMRSVPHRVVCLLGLDDGAFPRTPAPDGDDVLARRPLTGERDLRSEDRQLLLDAVMAAQDTLVATYTGFNEQNGSPRPPAVPLGELLDAAQQAAGGGSPVLLHHPLQSADARNFTPGALVPDRVFSFDTAGRRAAEAAASVDADVAPTPPSTTSELLPPPPDAGADLDLEDLVAFFKDPARAFLVGRLGVTLPWEEEPPAEGIPIELDGLEKWGVGDRVLTAVLEGRSPEEAMLAELRRGHLPPRHLGNEALTEIVGRLRPVAELTQRLRGRAHPAQPAVDVLLPDSGGRRLVGSVAGVTDDALVAATYSSTKGQARLATWIRVLALRASHPATAWQGHTIGRFGSVRRPQASHHEVTAPAPDTAAAVLADLVHLRDLGRRGLLPAPVETTAAVGAALWNDHTDAQPSAPDRTRTAALEPWTGKDLGPSGWMDGENARPAWSRMFGPAAPVDVVLARRIRDASGRSELGLESLARAIWFPLLDAERRHT